MKPPRFWNSRRKPFWPIFGMMASAFRNGSKRPRELRWPTEPHRVVRDAADAIAAGRIPCLCEQRQTGFQGGPVLGDDILARSQDTGRIAEAGNEAGNGSVIFEIQFGEVAPGADRSAACHVRPRPRVDRRT